MSTINHAQYHLAEANKLICGISLAAQAVLAERERQIVVEDWTAEHDDQLTGFQLPHLALRYVEHAARPDATRRARERRGASPLRPTNEDWFKPKDRRRDLVRAAALIIAEIERLDRAEARGK